jgi:hypothetical protein
LPYIANALKLPCSSLSTYHLPSPKSYLPNVICCKERGYIYLFEVRLLDVRSFPSAYITRAFYPYMSPPGQQKYQRYIVLTLCYNKMFMLKLSAVRIRDSNSVRCYNDTYIQSYSLATETMYFESSGGCTYSSIYCGIEKHCYDYRKKFFRCDNILIHKKPRDIDI